ncbi:hypothetical protein RUND412_005484 [Rhizina undulata]
MISSTNKDSVTANGPTEYSGTCGQASQLLNHSRPSHQHGPDTPVLSSYPRTSSSITAKDPTEYSGTCGQASLPMSNATVMDSVTTNGSTEYSGTYDHASKFPDHSFVPAPTDISATGSATSSEKASSSHDTSSSSNLSTSASEAGPYSNSARSFASAASFGSVSSSAYSTISVGQGPLNLSGLGLSASGAAWPRLQPFRRPATTNDRQFGVYSTSIYANHSNHGAISGEYVEAGPADVAIERLRAIVNNVATTPDAILGAFVSDTVVESNERLRIIMAGIMGRYSFGNEDEDGEYFTQSEYSDDGEEEEEQEEDRNEQEPKYHGHEDGEQKLYTEDKQENHHDEQEHHDSEEKNPNSEEAYLNSEKGYLVQAEGQQEHPEQVDVEQEYPIHEQDGEEEHQEQVDDESGHSEKVHGEKELLEQEPEIQEHSEQVNGVKELPKQEPEGQNPEEKEHHEQDYRKEHHDGDDASVSSLTSNDHFHIQVDGHPSYRRAARPQTPLDFSGLAFGKCIPGTVREYGISHIQGFAPIDLVNTRSDSNDSMTTRSYTAELLTDKDHTNHDHPNMNNHSRWNNLSNKFTTTTRDSEMGRKREKKSQTKTLKKKVKNDCDKAEKIFGVAMRKIKKLTRTGKAMAATVVRRV